jgi:integrase/recombinase XerD
LTLRFSGGGQHIGADAVFEEVFGGFRQNKRLDIEKIHRPKKSKILPNVLSKEEIKAILEAHGNLKHRAMLSLIYACGLRRSELLNLKPADVDSKRGILLIKQAKGKKDRIAPISGKIIELLQILKTSNVAF